MKRRGKNPDYQSIPFLTIVGYLAGPLEEPGAVGARICRLMLAQLGDHRVRLGGSFYMDGKLVKEEEHRGYLKKLIDEYESLIRPMQLGRKLSLGMGMPHYWGFYYNEQMALPAGQARHGEVNVHMYMDLFDKLNNDAEKGAWLPLVLDIVTAIDDGANYYGLAHAAHARDLDYGFYYGDNVPDRMTWREAVEHVDWFSSGDARQRRIRAPTWGTYLGAAQVAKLDGGEKGSFLRRYLEPRGAEPTHSGIELPSGAIFVATSNNPMEAVELPLRRHHDPVVENAVWLWQEFRKAGMV